MHKKHPISHSHTHTREHCQSWSFTLFFFPLTVLPLTTSCVAALCSLLHQSRQQAADILSFFCIRTLNAFLPRRYNVSCSQHFKSSRGRTGAASAPPPAPTESTVKRRGPPRRSSSSNASNKASSRHQLVKV